MTLHHTADMPHARTRYKRSVFIITTFIEQNFKNYLALSPFNISARAGRGTAAAGGAQLLPSQVFYLLSQF